MIEKKLPDFLAMQERCSNCSYCKWIPLDKIKSREFAGCCPAVSYYNFNAYSARGRFQLGRSVNMEEDIFSDGLPEMIHSCMACGACDVSCKICRYNLEPLQHNMALKAAAVEKGWVLPEQEAYRQKFWANASSPEVSRKKGSWAEGLGVKDLSKETAETLFFPGCKYSMDPALRENARFAAELLLKNGWDLGALYDNSFCCGSQLYQMGFQEDFEKAATANLETLKKAGVRQIVTPCADCYHAFKRLYAQLGLNVQVLHVTEALDALLQEGKLTFTKSIQATVTYHDPCHLGRQGEPFIPWDGEEKKILNQIHTWEPRRPRNIGVKGVYDQPRNLLSAIPGVTLAEMERVREYSWCCGNGGGCSLTHPDYAQATAKSRTDEAAATGAQILVTACSGCYKALKKTADDSSIQVEDILSLLRQAL